MVGISSRSQGRSVGLGGGKPRNGDFSAGVWLWRVADHDPQRVTLGGAGGHIEDDRPQSRDDAHQNGQAQQSDLPADALLPQQKQFGNPGQRAALVVIRRRLIHYIGNLS